LLDSLMNIALRYRDRIDASKMMPQVNWREARNTRRPGASAEVAASGPQLSAVGANKDRAK
jgi:hypothetical protein